MKLGDVIAKLLLDQAMGVFLVWKSSLGLVLTWAPGRVYQEVVRLTVSDSQVRWQEPTVSR